MNDDELAHAVEVLRAGGLVAFPTETVYGLGADALNDDAVRRVFAVKGRPADHPLIVHLASSAALGEWAAVVSDEARALTDAFWPGPLTVLVPRAIGVGDVVAGGRPTIGLRVPDHPVALALLDAFGGGIAAPSANRFGRVSPTTAEHVRADLDDDVDVVLDGGACRVGVESTIVDLSGGAPVVLRPGGVTTEQLAEVLGREVEVVVASMPSDRGAKAPGMLESHYAPDARVVLVDEREIVDELAALVAKTDGIVGVLAPGALAIVPDGVIELEPAGPADQYAQVLYARLRQADRLGLTVLVCVPPAEVGVGGAVRDRLRRAAAGR